MKLTNLHFLSEILSSRPIELPTFVIRRLREAVTTTPKGIALSRFGDVLYPVDLSLHAIARKYYFHTHEMYLERVFRENLKRGDIFLDIGANLGYWSALSSNLVGREGEIHAFEPVPCFFESLERFANANPNYHIVANQIALGAGNSILPMTVIEPSAENYWNFMTNIGASSLLPGFLDRVADLTRNIEVKVDSLDNYLCSHNIDMDKIGLIKIDVEGFEKYCLDGMMTILNKAGRKVPILCEILTDNNPSALLNGRGTIERFRQHGYVCLNALTFKPINPHRLQFEENILCV